MKHSRYKLMIKPDETGIFRFFILNPKNNEEEIIGESVFINDIVIKQENNFTKINLEIFSYAKSKVRFFKKK